MSAGLGAGCLAGALSCAAASAAPPPTPSATTDPTTAALRPSMRLLSPGRPEGYGLGLRDAGFERGAERLPHRLELDPVEHVLEEAANDQALRLRPGKAPCHQVEELVAVDLPESRAVGTADVVRHDLEAGNRVRVGRVREQEVAVLLVGVRLLGALLDADHPAPDRRGALAQGALEREVALGVRRHVLLEGVVVEVLRPVCEVGPRHTRRGALACEVVLDPDLAALGAEASDHPVELAVSLEPCLVATEMPRLLRKVLQRDVLDLRGLPDEDLDDRVRV